VLAALAVWIARYAWRDMILIGKVDPESSHVLLVPLVFVWLAWHRRARLWACRARNVWVGTILLGLGWLLWSGGYRFQFQVFWHGGAVLMAVGAVVSVFGANLFKALLPAFGALA